MIHVMSCVTLLFLLDNTVSCRQKKTIDCVILCADLYLNELQPVIKSMKYNEMDILHSGLFLVTEYLCNVVYYCFY